MNTSALPGLRALFFAIAMAVCFGAHAELAIRPAQPAAGSLVTIEGMSGCMNAPIAFSLDMASLQPNPATIKIFDPGWIDAPLMPCPAAKKNRLIIGPLPAGEYKVELFERITPTSFTTLRATASFTVTVKTNADFPPDWLGLWADPINPGWGLSIMRDPASGHIFSTWYVNERIAQGLFRPVWLVAPNMSFDGFLSTTLKGDLYRAIANRAFFDGSNSPYSLSQVDAAGTIQITFTSSTTATVSWSLTTANLFDTQLDIGTIFRRSGSTRLEKLVY